jgi:hypothetical protein
VVRIEISPEAHGLNSVRGRPAALAALLCLAAFALGAARAATAAPAPPAPEPDDATSALPGTWRSHQVEFEYVGFTSTYSCDGLQGKLQLLLRRLGARPDAHVSTSGCFMGPGSPSKFVHASLKFASLQPAEAAADPAVATEAASSPMGTWRHVLLAPHEPYDLDAGDCELVEQFRDLILPQFATRAPRIHLQCVPHQESAGGFSLEFDVFAPWPPAKAR